MLNIKTRYTPIKLVKLVKDGEPSIQYVPDEANAKDVVILTYVELESFVVVDSEGNFFVVPIDCCHGAEKGWL